MPACPATPPPGAPDPLLGLTLGGHYRLEALLGRGAMGAVYLARHTLLGQDLAVKVLGEDFAQDGEFRRRFLVEAHTLSALTHKHAVQIRHCGEDQGLLYLVMSLAPGEALDALLAREGALPALRAARMALQALEALEEAHGAGIVHRDIKPGNLMVETTRGADGTVQDHVRVVDFGLARLARVQGGLQGSALSSLGGHVVGTPAYMAPEQLRAEDVDGRADLFSTGVVLYEMLTGQPCFRGDSALSVAMRVVQHGHEPWPEVLDEAVSPALRDVVDRALEKSPDARFQSAGQMADAIRDALNASPRAKAGGRPARTGRSVRAARPARVVWSLGGLLVAAALVVGILVAQRPGGGSAPDAFRDAQDLLELGRYKEAGAAFDTILAATPHDRRALLGRAEARIELDDRNARDDLDTLARLDGEHAGVLLARARYLARVQKDPVAAREMFGQVLLMDRAHPQARYERGQLALEQGDLDGAESDARALIALAPQDPRGLHLRACLELRRSDRPPNLWDEEAVKQVVATVQEAAELDARWGEPYLTLCTALYRLSLSLRERGEHAAGERRTRELVDAGKAAVQKIRENPRHFRQGPRLAHALFRLAGSHFAAGESEQALACLDEAALLAPRDVLTRRHRAFALQELGRHEEAFRDFELIYDVTGESDAIFRMGFAWQQTASGRVEHGDLAGAADALGTAISIYTRGLSRFPSSVDLRTYRGEAYVRRAQLTRTEALGAQDLQAGRADLDAVLEQHSDERETLLRRAECALVQGQPRQALEDARRAIGSKRDCTARYYLARTRAALELAEESAQADADQGRLLLEEALDAMTCALSASPAWLAQLIPLRISVWLRMHRLQGRSSDASEPLDAAAEDLRKFLELVQDPKLDDRTRARLEAVALFARAQWSAARGEAEQALDLARQAIALREAEHQARRWFLSPAWYAELAGLEEELGEAAAAVGSRELARTLPALETGARR